jgi:hypothetical protein
MPTKNDVLQTERIRAALQADESFIAYARRERATHLVLFGDQYGKPYVALDCQHFGTTDTSLITLLCELEQFGGYGHLEECAVAAMSAPVEPGAVSWSMFIATGAELLVAPWLNVFYGRVRDVLTGKAGSIWSGGSDHSGRPDRTDAIRLLQSCSVNDNVSGILENFLRLFGAALEDVPMFSRFLDSKDISTRIRALGGLLVASPGDLTNTLKETLMASKSERERFETFGLLVASAIAHDESRRFVYRIINDSNATWKLLGLTSAYAADMHSTLTSTPDEEAALRALYEKLKRDLAIGFSTDERM